MQLKMMECSYSLDINKFFYLKVQAYMCEYEYWKVGWLVGWFLACQSLLGYFMPTSV